jgi:hypothetical protein
MELIIAPFLHELAQSVGHEPKLAHFAVEPEDPVKQLELPDSESTIIGSVSTDCCCRILARLGELLFGRPSEVGCVPRAYSRGRPSPLCTRGPSLLAGRYFVRVASYFLYSCNASPF